MNVVELPVAGTLPPSDAEGLICDCEYALDVQAIWTAARATRELIRENKLWPATGGIRKIEECASKFTDARSSRLAWKVAEELRALNVETNRVQRHWAG